jgi:hypothetical protein
MEPKDVEPGLGTQAPAPRSAFVPGERHHHGHLLGDVHGESSLMTPWLIASHPRTSGARHMPRRSASYSLPSNAVQAAVGFLEVYAHGASPANSSSSLSAVERYSARCRQGHLPDALGQVARFLACAIQRALKVVSTSRGNIDQEL